MSSRVRPLQRCAQAALICFVISCHRSQPLTPSPRESTDCRYLVDASQLEDLRVHAVWPATGASNLDVSNGGEALVHDVQFRRAGRWEPATSGPNSWRVPCEVGQRCEVRYGFRLREAGRRLGDPGQSWNSDNATVAPLATWLLRPSAPADDPLCSLHVTTTAPLSFATELGVCMENPCTLAPQLRSQWSSVNFAAFAPLRSYRLGDETQRVDVTVVGSTLPLADQVLLGWLQRARTTVDTFYQAPLISRLRVLFAPQPGNETDGFTVAEGDATVLIRVGKSLTQQRLDDDWVVLHELLHVGSPSLASEHAWLLEGIATYMEPLLRLREGRLTRERFWLELMRDLPQGLPQPGDRGLDRTPTWARTYWGGALFCFLADLQIRSQTKNQRSFDDVLRAVHRAGGHVDNNSWTMERVIKVGNAATNTQVLGQLYGEMAATAATFDLESWWRDLGVRAIKDRVTFDESARLAAVRRALGGEKEFNPSP